MDINKVFNEDCTVTMGRFLDNSIDLIVTDPPYGMDFQSGHRKIKHDKIVNDTSLDWMPTVFKECKRILKDDGHAYFFCSFHFIDTFLQTLKSVCFEVKNILIWHKNNTGMGDLEGDYAPQYEFIIFCSNGNKKLNGRRDSNILKFARTNNDFHPTQKPVDLIRFLIQKSSNENDIVFDGFMGCGTTAIASYIEHRNFIGSEIDPNHYNTCQSRLSKHLTIQQLF